ncbi:ExbD/TolR family protein [Reichenbachiella ulvae]|uniref:Uncharacterized protein n=1 Tax=Reichenbachiella ulvae TaxID=2980104 RepID=A0ABT3CWB2_9BACT|nr:hypothetical protein [Reichenbachiella ulvae]MCV9387804.1 hypothetical protein [Reichenbachiella ulvae]
MEESTEIVEVPLEVGNSDFNQGVNLSGVQGAYSSNHLDTTSWVSIDISINSDQIMFNGKIVLVEDLQRLISENAYSPNEIVSLRVDANQTMDVVNQVQIELRRLNMRKINYITQNPKGGMVQSRWLLMPSVFTIPDFEKEPNARQYVSGMFVRLDSETINETQKKVKEFVETQIADNNSNYLVDASFVSNSRFVDYLNNLLHLQEAFDQIYEERAQNMFRKGLNGLTDEEFNEVRKRVPISILLSCIQP